MKITEIFEQQSLTQVMIDNVFDNYDKLKSDDFHTTFIEHFDDYFTDEQVDSGKMDDVIQKQWKKFKESRGTAK